MFFYSKQLLAFMAVAQELHFGRAAQKLHVSQPPLSQQVLQFENSVGTKLLERTTRNVKLTHAGKVMFDALQRLISDGQLALDTTTRVAEGQCGFIRIGLTSTSAYGAVPTMIGEYRRRYPDVYL